MKGSSLTRKHIVCEAIVSRAHTQPKYQINPNSESKHACSTIDPLDMNLVRLILFTHLSFFISTPTIEPIHLQMKMLLAPSLRPLLTVAF
jgi:hypothetical protein